MKFIDKIKFKVIHSVYYFQRELFLLEIDGRYAMIYKGSGLNGGKVNRILPFHLLQDTPPRFSDSMNGVVLGYIWKNFYYNRQIISHRKRIEDFGEGINLFIEKLEKELENFKVEKNDYHINDVQIYAKEFNDIANQYLKVYETKPVLKTNWFDWGVLNLYYNLEKDNKK